VGGGRLHPAALETCRRVSAIRARTGADIDIVGCGGALDGASARAFIDAGASAVQVYSALIYRGLAAPAILAAEMQNAAKSPEDA
jgi:dihydroorotate dehydrogenase